ncbi:MAG: rhodanese-like domain-containing protein, partial [Pyrinomonadaceae bacterium]
MTKLMIPPLVSTSWLAKQIGSADLDILDASFFLPADQRDNRAEFEAAHIPGAQLFDLSEICDQTSSLPNMLPSPEDFAAKVAALGVSHTHRIVIYDNSPHHSSARAWWMFQVFGAHQVAILNGGFAEWEAEEQPTESGFVEATMAENTPS